MAHVSPVRFAHLNPYGKYEVDLAADGEEGIWAHYARRRSWPVNFYVEDVETAVRFYTEHFGFVETFRTPKQGRPEHVEVRLGPLILGLASKQVAQSVHGLPLGPGGGPRAEVVVWTEDVDEADALLTGRGVRGVSVPHGFPDSLRSAWVMDPDGNPVQIVSRRVARGA